MTVASVRYRQALRAYLAAPGEDTLRVAYEIGREAVAFERGLLDLAMAHEEALASVLDAGGPEGAGAVVRSAGEFFLECISTFEMVQRGVQEAHEATRLERRNAELLRGLSTFLSDSSLALAAPDTLAEVRSLVAEQAREFVGAACCFVTTGPPGGPAERSASFPGDDLRWRAFARWADLTAVDEVVWEARGAARLDGAEVRELLGGAADRPAGDPEVRGWLGAPLTALGGHQLGAIHLIDKGQGHFTVLDEAIVVHLAQMSAAAVERAASYGGS